jgi:hypothetical protein
MEAVVVQRDLRSRRIATFFASAGFLVMVVGVTYFAILVLTAHYGSEERRYTAFRELGMFLSGEGNLAWYQDARVYGAVTLLLALASLLFGVHPLARITLPVAFLIYVGVHLYGVEMQEMLVQWATSPP